MKQKKISGNEGQNIPWSETKTIFHTLWTKAVGKPDYLKKEWLKLRDLQIYKDGIDVG